MTTFTHPPVALHSPRLFHVHSSELLNQEDMESVDEAAHSLPVSHHTQYSQLQTHAQTQTQTQTLTDPPPHHLIHPPHPRPPPDFDMEGGADTAGISPPPAWEFDSHSQHRSATPHSSLAEAAHAAPPPVPAAPTPSTSLSTTPGGGTLLVSQVQPSPDSDRAHDPPTSIYPPDTEDRSLAAHDSQTTDREPGDEDDDSGDDDDEEEDRGSQNMQYYPFEEDLSVPSSEEIKIINSSAEHSALDDSHWQARTFFDIKDPEVLPGESGVIEWTIEGFNGTKDNPRKELLMRSPTVRIGKHEWRIKLLPRGHLSTDRVSAYIECVSLQAHAQGEWPEEQLPLPIIGDGRLPKREAVAAQISVLMYNPEEPRVNEFRPDAHQFQADSPDHGWSRFTTVPWHEMHRRSYMSRQPLLRNDKLAIKAFVRIVYDPTGCLWAHSESSKPRDSVPMTGLQQLPAFDDLAIGPVIALWLHLRPFRQVIYQLGAHTLASRTLQAPNPLAMLQAVLYRMRTRSVEPDLSRCRSYINDYVDHVFNSDRDTHDVMQTMDGMLGDVEEQLRALSLKGGPVASAASSALEALTGLFVDRKLQLSGSRKTKLSVTDKNTMQEVVDGAGEDLKALGSPQLLTIELDRQVFDRRKRCWKKVLNKVRLEDEISVGDTMYTLYGFAAHGGYLQTGRYTSYFRPNGLGNLWYSYVSFPPDRAGQPECLTLAKAVHPREGVSNSRSLEEPSSLHDRPTSFGAFGHPFSDAESVAYVALYVRSDVASDTFYMSCSEPWDVPQWILNDHTPKPPPGAPLGDSVDPMIRSEAPSVPHPQTSSTPPYDDGEITRPAGRVGQDGDVDMDDAVDSNNGISNANSSANETDMDIQDTITHRTINYLSQPFYNGQVKGNEYHGEGHLIYLSGDEYTGAFARGNREGFGTMVYQNGDTYEGSWREGKHDGHGTYTEKRSGNVYRGNFREGKKHGEGTTTWKISEEQSRLCQICYSEDANTAFYDCGHVVSCGECARSLEQCPVCRRRVRDVLRLFYTA